jgi:hypothetical protein
MIDFYKIRYIADFFPSLILGEQEMGAKFELNAEQGILRVVIAGKPTAEELIQNLKKIQSEPGYSHDLRLWDFRNSNFNLTKEELEQVAAQASSADSRPGKVAMLVKGDLAFGLARMYEMYRNSELTEVEVFRDESEALAWLGEKEA